MGGMQGMPNSGMPGNIQGQQGMQAGLPIHVMVNGHAIMYHTTCSIAFLYFWYGARTRGLKELWFA